VNATGVPPFAGALLSQMRAAFVAMLWKKMSA
jgi:hypothetical protein